MKRYILIAPALLLLIALLVAFDDLALEFFFTLAFLALLVAAVCGIYKLIEYIKFKWSR